jgi:carbonic anhydrase
LVLSCGIKISSIKFWRSQLFSIEDSIRDDIAILKASPLIKKSTQIVGLAYDIGTGLLTEITELW